MMNDNNDSDRIKNFGEVFTPKEVVNKMLDLIPKDVWQDITKTFLEPSCGDGNFLEEILKRKLKHCKTVEDKMIVIKTIYGIDILEDNVLKTRDRLKKIIIKDKNINIEEVTKILELNIVQGDTLQCVNNKGEFIKFFDWKTKKYETLYNMVNKQKSLFDNF